MSKSEVLVIIIKAFLSWLLIDDNHDGIPDRLEGFFGDAKQEEVKSEQ